jgi:hypothetical protein
VIVGGINQLVPQDKFDTARARAAVIAGYPAVKPILPHLLEWLQDINWPVAQILYPFLASIGTPLVPYIQHVLETDDEIWKHWVITIVISESPEVSAHFRETLKRIADSPTEGEAEEGLNQAAQEVLEKYGWAYL